MTKKFCEECGNEINPADKICIEVQSASRIFFGKKAKVYLTQQEGDFCSPKCIISNFTRVIEKAMTIDKGFVTFPENSVLL